jgi:short-subunit dehydrogenase
MNIIITGAGRGIGFSLTKIFLNNKHKVIAISRDISKLKALGYSSLHAFSFDFYKKDFSSLINFITNIFSKTDILINNAGLLINKPFTELSDDDFDSIFNINVKAAFKISRDLITNMNENSHIINISSMGGYQGSIKFPGLSLYSAAKGAIAILTEAMALELQEKNISVNALALGAVQTEMLTKAFPGYHAPLQPDEMAQFIYDFSINGNKYFNGKILPVSTSTP